VPLQAIPLFDTRYQHAAVSDQLQEAFERVLKTGNFILGSEVSAFEDSCRALLGAAHALGISNGSDALFLALRALGIGPGDEVITTAFTFVATAEAILRTGATPVFADIEPKHLCLSPSSTERLLTAKTRAVLYVHLYGDPGLVAQHAELCKARRLFLVEDACQAFGARVEGRAVGTWGHVGCFSFFPTKPLGGLGDGGLCVTNDAQVASRIRALRSHGLESDRYRSLGGNFRLDALQAALLRAKIACVEAWRIERENIARTYTEAFRCCRHAKPPLVVGVPNVSAWSVYTLRVPELRAGTARQGLGDFLSERGIESRVYYPAVLSDHPAMAACRCPETLHQSRLASREVLSIPIYFGLTKDAQRRVVDAVTEWDERQ
jgi:dTDP-4-amino-4,6-dideoxygalactose transaminase